MPASPNYQFESSKGSLSVDATTGRLRHWTSPQGALDAARAYFPGARGEYLGLVTEDTWSRRYSLNPHRPLHRIQFDDAAHTLVYVSSVTGEVLVTAPQAQRRWNYVGAWLHWLYYIKTSTRSRPDT